jgi:ligand-binding sensor domain-containing protein/signal transduction histidine kinase
MFVSKAQIGLIGFVFGLLLAACNGMVPVNAPTQTSIAPTVIPPQKITQEEPLPNMSGAIRFESLGLEDGLSQSTVLAILQDQFGFLWIGTEDGLNRYNGYTFKIFRPDLNNPDAISDRWITSLFEDRQGYIWIGTRQGGLNRYDPATGKFNYYLHDPKDLKSISSNNVTAILENKKGELWVGTNYGLDLLDRQTGKFQRFNSDPDVSTTISSNLITTLFEDSRGILWIGTDDGRLNRFNSATKNFTSYIYNPKNYSVVKGKSIKSIVEDHNGELWIASFEGLQHFKPSESSFTTLRHSKTEPSSLISDTVLSLYMDHSETLWVGTNEGLDRFDFKTNNFVHYQHDPGDQTSLSNNTILSIREDKGGVLWIGTFGGGLDKFNKGQRKFAYYHYEPGNPNSLSANYVSPIFADSSGHIWIGTYGGGLNRFNPPMGLFTHYKHDPENPFSLPSDDIYSVYVDKTGTLWVGTADALSRRNPSYVNFSHYINDPTNPESLAGGPVQVIFQDSYGSLWIGTANGLDLLDPSTGKFTHYQHSLTKPESISSDDITAIYEDKDGVLWVGTFDNGLNRFNRDTGTFVHYQRNRGAPQSLSDDSVTAIYQDQKNNLWIATAGGGLNLYHPETNSFQHYTENNGLPNNVIYGILEDDSGQLWLSTNYGLSRFDPENGTFRNYTDSDGLQSNEFNMGAYAKGLDHKMYFGGINGLNAFFPDEVKNNTYAPPVVLTSFTPGGQPDSGLPQAEELSQVTLGWPNNNFGFEIAALSFAEPGRNQYAYKLENFDKDWNYVGTSREGRYTNLAGGTYTLRFMGTNNDGVWNESNQVIQITVIPPFWETWTFRILITLSVIALGVIAYRLRVHSIQSQNLQLELTVRERTSALQKRTEELEALYSGDEKIIRAITLDQVFDAIVAVAVSMLHADRGAVFAWDEKQMQVVPRVSHGFMPESLQVLHFGKREGMIGEVLETGIPLIITELDPTTLRPDVRAAIVAEGIHSLLNLPIKVNDQTLGVFNVGFTRPGAITEDTARLYTALVQRAALSVENMQLFEQTKELAVIEERNRVARDLHDSAKQKAFAALAQLGAVSGILKRDPSNAWSHLSEAENLVYEVIQELTFLIQEMYPMALKEKGLATTLREYVFEWENRNGVMINLAIQNAQRMPLETEQAIYRMIQEALANVARHSQADAVNVSLVYNSETVTLTVEDNGLGFDAKHKAGGMGLRIINERAKSIGGQACVESEAGKGTKIMITAPLNGHV